MKLKNKLTTKKIVATVLSGILLASAGIMSASAYNSFEEPDGKATHVHLGPDYKLYTSDAPITGTFKRFWGDNNLFSGSSVTFKAQYHNGSTWVTAAETTMKRGQKFEKIQTGRLDSPKSWRLYVGTTDGKYNSHADGYMENRDNY